MLEVPKQIKVGPYTFQVNARDRIWYRDTEAYGQMHADTLEIDCYVHSRPIITLGTLIHEVFHAIWFVYNISEKDDEERIVTTKATGWTAVLRDNPDLVRFQNMVMQDYHPQEEQ